MDEMQRVLVTGGAGFIGSHLVEELARRDYHVTALDDLSTGKPDNIERFSSNKNIDFVKGSVTDLPLLLRLFQNTRYVFHHAAIPSVPRSIDLPLDSHEANITGTLNVLLAARDNKVDKVIFASSSSVYGDSETLPQKEDMTPNPLSPYAVTKLTGEYYCRVFHQVYGLPTVCLRYFNIYGPRQVPDSPYSAVIPRFIKMSLDGTSPVIYGDGEQTRDFTFVKDAVEANILAAESDAYGVYNISRGEGIALNRLAELVTGLIGNKIKPTYQPERPGDVKHSLADISKAKTFGYEPKYSLEAGLTEMIRWFDNR